MRWRQRQVTLPWWLKGGRWSWEDDWVSKVFAIQAHESEFRSQEPIKRCPELAAKGNPDR